MLLSGPALAMVWWLRHTWSVQVFAILVLMVAGLCIICGVINAILQLVRLLIEPWDHQRDTTR